MKTPKTKEQIEKLISKIPEDKSEEAEVLSNEMYFVIDTLEQLKNEVKEKGVTEHFEQGKQNFIRENPALKSYIQLMKTYDSLYKNITTLLKQSEEVKEREMIEDRMFEDFMFDNSEDLFERYQEETGKEANPEAKEYIKFCRRIYERQSDDFEDFINN